MEAPKFFNNKAAAFSSAFLALSLAACGREKIGKNVQTPTAIPPMPAPQEQKPLTVNTNVVDIDGSPVLSQLTVDHNCGVVLKPGDKTTISIPLNINPAGATLDFDLTLIKEPSGRLIFASLPVENGHSIALVDSTNNLIPLGNSLPIGQDQILFAFFTERKFKVKDCAVDNPSLQ
jgi:hypothetical protein